MASGSKRTRVDEFFTSKKRTAISPGFKSERSKIAVKTAVQGSPSAKGTLDNCLVTSQGDKDLAKPSYSAGDSRQDAVKRNLALEIHNFSMEELEQTSSSKQLPSQTSKAVEAAQKETSRELSSVGCSTSAHGVDNSEIKKFAADFLSLYCSDFQSDTNSRLRPEVNDQKNNACEKKHCTTNQSHLDGNITCSNEKNPEDLRSGLVDRTLVSVFSPSGEVTDGNSPVELQQYLKRCSNTPKPSINMMEFCTPGSSTVKAPVNETPKSRCGSSMFSPGEAFWNEAIQLADGLGFPMVNFSAQPDEETDTAEIQYHTMNLCHFRNGGGQKSLEKALDKGENRADSMEMSASLQSPVKHTKDLVKGVSLLPVKHFDFASEDKSLGESTIPYCNVDGSQPTFHRGGEKSEWVSVSHEVVEAGKLLVQCGNTQTDEKIPEVEGMTLVTRGTGGMVCSETDHISNSPVNLIKNSIPKQESEGASTPSNCVPLESYVDLNQWLPSEICSIYRKRGISKLYPWQVECLQVDGVLQRRNLVYCASTSAGKSFVAEILMLRRVVTTGKVALLVLPYVSICTEKAEHLEALLEPLGKHVRSYYGSQGGGTLHKDTSIAVCTIEKANSLINRLLEEGRLSEIGIIVIDELHMVGDPSRGYLLELMLTKLRYAAGEGNSETSSGESSGTSSGKADPAHGLQIVGMSATMPNVAAVADWLQAALYQTDFRPVPLEEYVKVGSTIYNKKLDVVRTIPKVYDLGGKDPDHIVELCNEVVQEGHSVLIFCSSRKGCESTARHVSKFLKRFTVNVPNDESEFVDTTSAIDALGKCPAGLDPTLEETLPSGVAYHHAGLTVEEREIVETCYRRGLLRVLTATSTLAAGVNLPARRVIFRQPRIGRDFIDGTRYRQMAGRAGRTGIDTRGESVLICKPDELKRIAGLLNESCPPLHSCLSEDINGMTHAILEVVAGGIVQTADDIHRYVRCTLLNSTKPFQDVVKSAQESLRWLCHRKFLEWNEDTKLYSTTPLGRAAFGSSLSPEESLIVLDDLSRAREGFVLASDLHLVYLVTPTNVDVEPDWELYYGRFMELSALDQSVGNRVGVVEPFLMRMAHGAPIRTSHQSRYSMKGLHSKRENGAGIRSSTMLSDDQTLRVCKRFYVALILSRLVQEVPVAEVCGTFKVARGMVQALQENAGRFASMVSVFCERLGWHDLEGLVAKFQNRVSFGVRAEIVELTMIPFVKGSRARALYKAGLRTPLAIAEASIPEIVKALFESSSWAGEDGSAQRRIQLGVAKKIKSGARKIVLDKAEEARVVAFSAFKSLGLDVPHFSRSLLSTAIGDHIRQGAETISPIDNTSSGFVDVKRMKPVSAKPSTVENESFDKASPESEGEKSIRMSDVVLEASAEVNPTAAVYPNFGAESSVIPVDGSVTGTAELIATVTNAKCANMTCSIEIQKRADDTGICGGSPQGIEEQHNRKGLYLGSKYGDCVPGPINASNTAGGFDSFLDLWDTAQEFYFDVHYNKRSDVNSVAPFEIHGIAICWENSPVYYVNLPKDLLWSDNKGKDYSSLGQSGERGTLLPHDHLLKIVGERWNRISKILGKTNVKKFAWNLKVQIQVLRSPVVSVKKFGLDLAGKNLGLDPAGKNLGLELIENSYLLLAPVYIKDGIDMCIVAWILWPDEERSSNPNLEKEVKKRLSSEAVATANQSGRWRNQMRRAAHNGCCRRVAQTRALCSVLWKLVVSEELIEALMNIEIPLVNVLADMELWGVGVDIEGCLHARNLLGKKLRHLEKEAHKLAGMSFSLYTTADIAHVLYVHLKLPIPEGHEGKQHPSTDKYCLDMLRNEHPIIPVIKEHRTLAKLLNCTLGSISSLARLSRRTQRYTLHGHWLQTSTATGRLSMEEPNLQCVEHEVDFKMNKDKNGEDVNAANYKINARDFFVPTQDDWLLLAADYSQIELRLMAHFSKDSSLIEVLSMPNGDVFTMIAARWTGKADDCVDSNERDQTKRLVYGILYGMGANTLAEQLRCSSDEAAEKIRSFKNSFPGVASWLREAIASCRQKGYIETLKGRKRFLSKIKFGNSKERSKAQRQAVNSICQGSAADIIKIAMINIYSTIVERVDRPDSSSFATKFQMLKGRCRIILQVHDELILEVDPSMVKEAALLLQMSMENATSLLVPLHVKLKVGRTWGSLEPFPANKF